MKLASSGGLYLPLANTGFIITQQCVKRWIGAEMDKNTKSNRWLSFQGE
jgi:hypothetical protein